MSASLSSRYIPLKIGSITSSRMALPFHLNWMNVKSIFTRSPCSKQDGLHFTNLFGSVILIFFLYSFIKLALCFRRCPPFRNTSLCFPRVILEVFLTVRLTHTESCMDQYLFWMGQGSPVCIIPGGQSTCLMLRKLMCPSNFRLCRVDSCRCSNSSLPIAYIYCSPLHILPQMSRHHILLDTQIDLSTGALWRSCDHLSLFVWKWLNCILTVLTSWSVVRNADIWTLQVWIQPLNCRCHFWSTACSVSAPRIVQLQFVNSSAPDT